MDTAKLQQYAPIIVVVILIVAAVYVYSSGGTTQGTQIVPGQNNSSERAAASAANAAAYSQHEQTVFGGFSKLVDLATTQFNDTTSIQLGSQTLSDKIAGYNRDVAVSTLQERALEAQANAERDIQQAHDHASQQNSFWGGLFGAAATIFGVHK